MNNFSISPYNKKESLRGDSFHILIDNVIRLIHSILLRKRDD